MNNLSEEEKKAIEELKHYCNLTQYWKNVEYAKSEFDDYINTVLQVIEKQQKEIKRLEARKYIYNAVTGEISQITLNNNYISKDKIKAKIEYYKKIDNAVGIRVLQSLLEEE